MNKAQESRKYIVSTLFAVIGGGVAGAVSAALDPAKYRFPQDFGTGKLWPFFFMGAALTLGGIILQSPLGQRVLLGIKTSQQQIAQSQAEIQQAKKDLGAKGKP